MKSDPSRLYSRKYGQVLLRNPKVAKFEVSALGMGGGSRILEIGPGPGILTALLLEKGYIVTSVEADHRFAEELAVRFSGQVESGQLSIIKENFLKFQEGEYDGIIGNVPYQISSEIVFRLGLFSFTRAVLMFQKEFCDRLVASHGSENYSRLSVNAQLRFRMRIIAKVSRRSFSPVPGVDSAVVELTPLGLHREEDIMRADEIFRKLFANRRKKISSTLKWVDEEIGEKRVEEIPPEKLLELASGYLSRRYSP